MKWLTEEIAQRAQFKKLVTVPAALFVVGYSASLYSQRAEFFEMSPASVVRQEYGGNPFPEAIEFGKYIREHSEASDRGAVLGSEPEIYFYAARPFSDRIYLHLRIDGGAEVRVPDAAGNDG